jgi:hypothetical protein
LDAFGQVYKESPGTYLDGSTPVLMSFKTSWIKVAGLQGYQRTYFFYLLAKYLSAHTMTLNIYYDFATTPGQILTLTPGTTALENWRVFLKQQRCQAFQLEIIENYAGTPGAAFDLSGINLIAGIKQKFLTMPAANTIG